MSITRSATSSRRAPDHRVGLLRPRLRDRRHGDHSQAARPRLLRHLDRQGREAARREDDHQVVGPKLKFERIVAASPGMSLDEHRLALAVGADDLRVERHRQLDDRVEARVRAVAREHLLDRDARVACAEEVDQAAAGDRVGAPLAGGLDGIRLRVADALEQRLSPRRTRSPRPAAPASLVGAPARGHRRPQRPAGGACFAGPELLDDPLGLRRADARHAERHHRQQPVQRPHAAGGLDLDVRRVLARIRRRSSCVAPLGAKPVLVLTKSAPARSVAWQARIFSSSVR